MVLRRIETRIPELATLKLPPIIEQLALLKRGLVILVGATGAGKSTSLAAMIGHRNSRAVAISSRSRTPSSSFMSTRTASLPSARWGSTPIPTKWR